ncbi:hypothetical protein Bbelb_386960 [Branchiostoma belcheri]|nr:hypothetical protein Bbelb_386960 [Branchiostoma belcheri]
MRRIATYIQCREDACRVVGVLKIEPQAEEAEYRNETPITVSIVIQHLALSSGAEPAPPAVRRYGVHHDVFDLNEIRRRKLFWYDISRCSGDLKFYGPWSDVDGPGDLGLVCLERGAGVLLTCCLTCLERSSALLAWGLGLDEEDGVDLPPVFGNVSHTRQKTAGDRAEGLMGKIRGRTDRAAFPGANNTIHQPPDDNVFKPQTVR